MIKYVNLCTYQYNVEVHRLLKKMNRHYSKEHYLEIIEKAKKEIPDIAFSTDLMIGFPGETEEDLLDTIDVVRKVKYDTAFTFIYSKREAILQLQRWKTKYQKM